MDSWNFASVQAQFSGVLNVVTTDIDTRNGGIDLNQVSLCTGNRTDDLSIVRDIMAGNGTVLLCSADRDGWYVQQGRSF